LNVLWFKKRVFGKKGVAVRIHREQLQNATYRDPHSANAGLTGAFAWLDCNAIKRTGGHMASLDYVELAPAWPSGK
jgi:hypothetical protein